MKLFYTRKDFRDLVEKHKKEIKDIKEQYTKADSDKWFDLNSKIDDLEKEKRKISDKCTKLEETNKYHQGLIELRDSDIAKLSKKITEATEERTEFVAKINELTKKVEEAKVKFEKYREEKEIEIADLKSDRYLRVTPPTKNRRTNQKMQIYSKRRTSGIIKNVKEKL